MGSNLIPINKTKKPVPIEKAKVKLLNLARQERDQLVIRLAELADELELTQQLLTSANQRIAELDGSVNAVEDTKKYIAAMKSINEPRLSREEIISEKISTGHITEAKSLCNLWKLAKVFPELYTSTTGGSISEQ